MLNTAPPIITNQISKKNQLFKLSKNVTTFHHVDEHFLRLCPLIAIKTNPTGRQVEPKASYHFSQLSSFIYLFIFLQEHDMENDSETVSKFFVIINAYFSCEIAIWIMNNATGIRRWSFISRERKRITSESLIKRNVSIYLHFHVILQEIWNNGNSFLNRIKWISVEFKTKKVESWQPMGVDLWQFDSFSNILWCVTSYKQCHKEFQSLFQLLLALIPSQCWNHPFRKEKYFNFRILPDVLNSFPIH